MTEQELEKYLEKHRIGKKLGYEYDTLKSAILGSLPMRSTTYNQDIYLGGKRVITWFKTEE